MSEPQTVEEHAARLYKLVSYGLGYGMSHDTGRRRIFEYMEKYFHPAIECRRVDSHADDCPDPEACIVYDCGGVECCQDEIPTHAVVP